MKFRALKIAIGCVALGFTMPAIAQNGVYEGQIDGEFKVWEGETVYKLMDGHIIQQAAYHYHYHYAYSPRVLIYTSRNGQLMIEVDGDSDDAVAVNVLK
jgi:hypothetical protein